MSEHNSSMSRALSCGIMGAVAGLVFAAVFYVVAEYEATQAIFAGIVIAIVVALLLLVMLSGGSKTTSRAPATDLDKSGGNAANRAGLAPTTADAAEVAAAQAPTAAAYTSHRSGCPRERRWRDRRAWRPSRRQTTGRPACSSPRRTCGG